MKTIILFYEHKARELQLYEMLKKQLERESNYSVAIYILSYHYEKDKAISILRHNEVVAIFVPFAYDYEALKFYVKFYEINPKLVIINLHHEEITMPAMDEVVLPRDEYSKNSIYHFVWTDNFKNKLISVGTHDNLVYVTGNGRNDISKSVSISKEQLAQAYNLDPQKKWLLYAENRKPDQIYSALISFGVVNDAEAITSAFRESYYQTIKEFEDLPDSFFNDYELIYRLHPGSNPISIKNDRIKQIREHSIYDWLVAADCVIVFSSTTAFEADMYDVPVIVHDPNATKKDYFTEGLDFYYKIEHLKSVNNEAISSARKQQLGKKHYEEYMGLSDGNCISRIASITISLISSNQVSTDPLSIDLPPYYYLLRLIRTKLFRVYKKSGLLNLIRKPDFIYNNQEDVPY